MLVAWDSCFWCLVITHEEEEVIGICWESPGLLEYHPSAFSHFSSLHISFSLGEIKGMNTFHTMLLYPLAVSLLFRYVVCVDDLLRCSPLILCLCDDSPSAEYLCLYEINSR